MSVGSPVYGRVPAVIGHSVAIKGPRPWVDVMAYGATGDGATDDTAAFTAAAAACVAGDTLLIPRGTYLLDGSAWQPTVNNVTIRGAGWGSVLKLKDSAAGGRRNLIELGSVSGWTIRDLALDGNRANNLGFTAAQNNGHGVWTQGSPTNCLIENVYCHDTRRNGIYLLAGSYLTVSKCLVDGTNLYDGADQSGSEGGLLCQAAHSKILDNTVQNWWKEIYIAAPDVLVRGNHIIHGTVQQNDANGIEVYQTSGIASYQGYWSSATAYTINQTVLHQGRYWKAAGSSTGQIPSESNTANWTLLALAYRCIVTDNLIENVWWEGIQMGTGSAGSIVANNVIRSYGVAGTPGTTNYGILVNDPEITVAHNRLSGWRGAIYCEAFSTASILTSRYTMIDGNEITAPFDGTAVGGGIYTRDLYQTVVNNVIEGCQVRIDTGDLSMVAHNRIFNAPTVAMNVVSCLGASIIGNTVDTTTGANSDGIVTSGTCARLRFEGNIVKSTTRFGMYIQTGDYSTFVGNTSVDNASDGIRLYQCKHCVISGNVLTDSRSGGSRTQANGLVLTDGGSNSASDFHTVVGNDLSNNTTNAIALTTTGGTSHQNNKISQNQGYNPKTSVTQITVGASTVAVTNTNGVDCQLTIAGGTITVIAIGGVTTGLTSGAFYIPAGQTVTVTYSVAPTSFVWIGC